MAWPRRGLGAVNFDFKVTLAVHFRPRHINVLELRAILLSILAVCRDSRNLGKRVVHAADSQVSIAVLCKGRSSARTLCATVRKISAAILASSLHMYYVFVESARNPADEPSRW